MQYSFDNEMHWKECTVCGATSEKSAHIIENELCIVCDQSVQPTEGVIYDISSDGTYAEVVGYKDLGIPTSVKIASEYNGLPVTNINDEAFYGTCITSVVIPDSVTTIGYSAFGWCDGLGSVVIGNSVTTIGEEAFSGCYRLSSIVIPESVTTIGVWAFANCNGLSSIVIPNSVTTIGYSAFGWCDGLTDVYYTGSEEEWQAITIGSENYSLTGANIICNYVPEK